MHVLSRGPSATAEFLVSFIDLQTSYGLLFCSRWIWRGSSNSLSWIQLRALSTLRWQLNSSLHLVNRFNYAVHVRVIIRWHVIMQAGYTPLHTACHFGQINMIEFLLRHGASVNATTQVRLLLSLFASGSLATHGAIQICIVFWFDINYLQYDTTTNNNNNNRQQSIRWKAYQLLTVKNNHKTSVSARHKPVIRGALPWGVCCPVTYIFGKLSSSWC